MAEALTPYEVSNLRKWLVDVVKRIGLVYWDLLKLSYFDDFPFGALEVLQDPTELYNQLASSQTFSATESFQLLLRRLALLREEGWSCIKLLRDPKYQLSQPESSPKLEQKLSRESQLMEAIVAALVEVSQEQRSRLLLRLGQRQLHFHRDYCTLFRVISHLRYRHIITTERTNAFVEALQYVRAPRAAVEQLMLYHARYNLDQECFEADQWDAPRPASLPPDTILRINSGGEASGVERFPDEMSPLIGPEVGGTEIPQQSVQTVPTVPPDSHRSRALARLTAAPLWYTRSTTGAIMGMRESQYQMAAADDRGNEWGRRGAEERLRREAEERLRRKALEVNRKVRELHKLLTQSEERVRELEKERRDAQRRIGEAEQRAMDLEIQLTQLGKTVREAERERREAEQRAESLKKEVEVGHELLHRISDQEKRPLLQRITSLEESVREAVRGREVAQQQYEESVSEVQREMLQLQARLTQSEERVREAVRGREEERRNAQRRVGEAEQRAVDLQNQVAQLEKNVRKAERGREEADRGRSEADSGRRETEEKAESLKRQDEEEHEQILNRSTEAPIVTQDPQFPGIHFLGTPWKETVTSEGQEISWESIGVAFRIPHGAVPEDKEVQLIVRPCLSGPFEPPDLHQLTSPSYLISHSCDFIPEIEISMDLYHSVHLRSDDECKRMTFLSAPSRPTHDGDRPQYKFKVLKGGIFSKNERHGTIKLQHFCFVGTGILGRKPTERYSARLYNNSPVPGGPCTRAAFCVVPYQGVYTTHVEAYMQKVEPAMKASADYIEEPVEFDDNGTKSKVTLELPTKTPGFKIIPLKEPLEIFKWQVDSTPPTSIDSYPKKLTLVINREGKDTTSCSELWSMNILGFTQRLLFKILFPPLTEAKPHTTGLHTSEGVNASRNGATFSAASQSVTSGVHELKQRAIHLPEDHDITSADFAVFNDHPPELHELCDAAAEIADLHDQIGIGLGMTPGQLRIIRQDTAGTGNQMQQCLTEVFNHWKDGANLPYTWELTFASVLLQPRLSPKTKLLLKGLHKNLIDKYYSH